MKLFTLSPKEQELMNIFWEAGEPLGRSEILERAAQQGCTWKPSYIHIMLNALLKKGAVRAAGYYLNGRSHGRNFEAAIDKEDYAVMQVLAALEKAEKLLGRRAYWMGNAAAMLPKIGA